MIRRFARRAYGSISVLGLLPGQRRIAHTSPETVSRKVDRRVRATVRYAADTVPYYQEMFRERGIDPQLVRTAADLEQFPILEKHQVREAPDHFRSSSAKGRHALAFTTSGTTGEPLTIYHDLESLTANIVYCEPEKQVTREILGRRRDVRQLSMIYGSSTIKNIWQAYRELTFIPTPSEESLLSVEATIDDNIAIINEQKPDILSGYGSYLEALFRYIQVKNIKMHLPDLVTYGADAMTTPGQTLIQEHFGIPVLSRYGSVESLRIGFTCQEGTGFHIRNDLCHLRVVDENGCNMPAGESGQIVISNLVNRGSVLLNYRLGDIGALVGSPCPCGRPQPLLTGLDGRAEDIITLKNGQIVHPRVIWGIIKEQQHILRYQLNQHAPDHFVLQLVTEDSVDFDPIAEKIINGLRKQLVDSVIECISTDHIETPRGGKFRPVIALRPPGDCR